MTEVIVWIAYLLAVSTNVFALSIIKWDRMRFMDGVLIGCIYYIVAPMMLILVHGELPPNFIEAASYLPFKDIDTTTVLIGGILLVGVLHIATQPIIRRIDRTDPRMMTAMLLIFATSSIYALVNSGILSGGHWYRATSDAVENSGSFLIVKHIANFSRTAIFGILLYWNMNRGLSKRATTTIGFAVVSTDLLMTFNRITGVYFLIMLIILYRRSKIGVATTVGMMLFLIPPISNMWPMFRGLLSEGNYSVDSIKVAAVTAFDKTNSEVPAVESLNGVFESVNIVVLNYVVKHYGADKPLLNGDMFVRPFTFFLPKMIWPNRPANYGLTLGYEINQNEDLALNSTMLGEPVANFGAFWWVALAILLIIYEFLARWLSSSSVAIGFVSAFVAFAMWRFDGVFAAISFSFAALLLTILYIIRPRARRGFAQKYELAKPSDDPVD